MHGDNQGDAGKGFADTAQPPPLPGLLRRSPVGHQVQAHSLGGNVVCTKRLSIWNVRNGQLDELRRVVIRGYHHPAG